MNQVLLIAVLFVSIGFCITSCSKASMSLVKDTWSGYYVRDSVFASSKDSAERVRFDCPGDFKWNADTTLSYNHGEPEAIPQTWQEISAGDMHWITVIEISPGYWQRVYFIFKAKKSNP